MARGVSCAASALLAASCATSSADLPGPREVERSSWAVLELGGVPIGFEARTEGTTGPERVVLRERVWHLRIDGRALDARGASRAVLGRRSEVLSYRAVRGGEPQAWRETRPAWIVDLAPPEAAGTWPLLDPGALTVADTALQREGPRWTWRAHGAELEVRVDADNRPVGGAAGAVSWTLVDGPWSLEPVDPVALLVRPARSFPSARSAHAATWVLGDEVRTVEVPLAAELPADLPVAAPEPGRWTRAERGLEVGHPDLVARAEAAVAGARGRPDAVARLVRSVSEALDRGASPGSVDALTALQQGRGDCNEYAYALVALARTAGIPSRVVGGLVYLDGAHGPGLYPHAWAEVRYPGARWVGVDPALGQPVADAAHLPLGETGAEVALRTLSSRTVELRDVR